MRLHLEKLASVGVAAAAAVVAQPELSETIAEVAPVAALEEPTAQMAVIGVAAFVPTVLVLGWLRRLVFGPRLPKGSDRASRQEPSTVESSDEVDRFGVTWEVLEGHEGDPDDVYAYAEDPTCPECGADVVPETKEGRVGGDTEIWQCPDCGYTTERPGSHLFHEHEAVEKMVDERREAAA